MKRVRCPKCDNYITFDETQYALGQQLVFVCPQCQKQFGIRIGTSKLRDKHEERNLNEKENEQGCGSIVVVGMNQFNIESHGTNWWKKCFFSLISLRIHLLYDECTQARYNHVIVVK